MAEDRSYEELHPEVQQRINRKRRFTEKVSGGLPELLKNSSERSSTYQALVNPQIRRDYSLEDTNTAGYVVDSPYKRDDYANMALPDEIWMRPDLKNPEVTASHETNHILARKQLGGISKINQQFDELLGDFTTRKNKAGEEEKIYQGRKRADFVRAASDAYPYLQEKYGLKSAYFQPEMLEFQAKAGKLPNLLYEQLATLASIEDTQGVDLTKDPVLRKTLFKDRDVRETYNALTGLRMTRMDSKDLPPMTRVEEPTTGTVDKLKRMIGFANGGYVENAGNKKLI